MTCKSGERCFILYDPCTYYQCPGDRIGELERVDVLEDVSGTPNDNVCAEADGRDGMLRLGEVRGAGGGK